MDNLRSLAHETLGLVMAMLCLLAVSSFVILWTLRPFTDEDADEENQHKSYENALFTYGAFLPYYVPDILASNPDSQLNERGETATQYINKFAVEAEWKLDLLGWRIFPRVP